jgi:hypothetical protein
VAGIVSRKQDSQSLQSECGDMPWRKDVLVAMWLCNLFRRLNGPEHFSKELPRALTYWYGICVIRLLSWQAERENVRKLAWISERRGYLKHNS